jgi:hypothetical protein
MHCGTRHVSGAPSGTDAPWTNTRAPTQQRLNGRTLPYIPFKRRLFLDTSWPARTTLSCGLSTFLQSFVTYVFFRPIPVFFSCVIVPHTEHLRACSGGRIRELAPFLDEALGEGACRSSRAAIAFDITSPSPASLHCSNVPLSILHPRGSAPIAKCSMPNDISDVSRCTRSCIPRTYAPPLPTPRLPPPSISTSFLSRDCCIGGPRISVLIVFLDSKQTQAPSIIPLRIRTTTSTHPATPIATLQAFICHCYSFSGWSL